MLNIGIGLVLGALVVWFLIGPANAQRINRQADEKVVEYSGKMASQEAQLNQLQSQIDSLNETTASAQQQIQDAQTSAASYENLLKAVEAQQQGNTSGSTNALPLKIEKCRWHPVEFFALALTVPSKSPFLTLSLFSNPKIPE